MFDSIPYQGAAAHAATPELNAIYMYLIKFEAKPTVTLSIWRYG
jgi:hypothetical protein